MAIVISKPSKNIRMSKVIYFFVSFAVILLFCLSSRIFHRVLLSDGESSKLFIVVWLLVYSVSILYLFKKRIPTKVIINTYPLLLFIFFCFLSSLWSISFKETIQDSVTLFGCLLFSIAIWSYLGNEGVLDLINLFLRIVITLSLLSIIFLPGYSIDAERFDSSWIGLFSHKNYFGRLSALLFLFSVFYKFKLSNLFFASISLVCVFLSTSVGALFLVMSVTALLSYFRLYGRVKKDQKTRLTVFAFLTVLFVLLILQQYYVEFLNAFGKDATLTGRTALWAIAEKFALQSPLFGYGYSAFWSKGSFTAEQFLSQSSWEAPHAHNGYIDLILDVGVVGLTIFSVSLILVYRRSVSFLSINRVYIPLGILFYLTIANFAEKIITVGNDFHWILFCVTYLIVLNPDFGRLNDSER